MVPYSPEHSKLIVKHLNGSLSMSEQAQLNELRKDEDFDKLFNKLTDPQYLKRKLKMMEDIGTEAGGWLAEDRPKFFLRTWYHIQDFFETAWYAISDFFVKPS